MRRRALRKREGRRIVMELCSLGIRAKCDLVERIETDRYTLFLCDGFPIALMGEGRIIPTIMAVVRHKLQLPRVFVDRGAVPHILNGARVMGPGITDVKGEVSEGDIVLICGPDGKILAIGVSRRDRDGLLSRARGVAVENSHHVGDAIWRDFSHVLVRGRGGA